MRSASSAREIDHHDGVFLHDTDQQNDSDQRDDVEVGILKQIHQREYRKPTPADGSVERIVIGMNVAFVQTRRAPGIP